MTTESFETITGSGTAVAFSHSPQQFSTITGAGAAVAFTAPAGPATLNFDTLTTAAQAGSFQALASTAFSQPTLVIEAWDAANTTLLGTLDDSFDRRFQDEFSGTGSASLSMLATDADVSLATRTLRWKVGGTYAFASKVEQRRWATVARGEEADQTVTLSGRGIVSEWDDAVVFPYGGINARPISDQRGFAWWSPELSTAGWPSATVVHSTVSTLSRLAPPIPDPWFTPIGYAPINDNAGADWIFSGTPPLVQTGSNLFRTTFTSAAERVSIYYTASSRCRVWVDGIAIADWTTQPNEESFVTAFRATPLLSAGTHHLAIEVDVQAWTPTLPGFTRGILSAAVYGGGGRGTPYSSANRLVGTSSAWKSLFYPAVFPAPTPGKILSTLLSEAQARGALTGWTLSCTDSVDSAGQPWPTDTAHVFRVGDTYLDVLNAMSDSSIEYRARPVGKVLDVYRRNTVTVAAPATYTAGSSLLAVEEDQPL